MMWRSQRYILPRHLHIQGRDESTTAGENISPPLEWTDVPDGTASFALVLDSNEAAGPWTHWVVWNIPSDTTGLGEGISDDGELPDGTRQGVNSKGAVGYLGPCPPPFAIIDANASGDVVRSQAGTARSTISGCTRLTRRWT